MLSNANVFFICLFSYILPYIFSHYMDLTLFGSHLIFPLPFCIAINLAFITHSIIVVAHNIKIAIELYNYKTK